MPTLPPTWTPTDTPSPAPPTRTPTVTDTPTPEPTRSTVAVCAAFLVDYGFEDGAYFPWSGQINIIFGSDDPRYPVRFLATHRLSGENLGVEVPGGQPFGMQFPVERLPRHGLYDWSLTVVTPQGDEICRRGGFVFVGAPGWE